MAQLTMRLSEDKYKSSYERIAKTIREYSDNVGFDLSNLAEQVLFSWIIGNSDMHLKNFSLIKSDGKWGLSPTYDMLNVKLALPNDAEDLALTLNGKDGTYQYTKVDFVKAFKFECGSIPQHIDIVSYNGVAALKNSSLLQFVLSKFDASFILFDLDAKQEVIPTLSGLKLKEKKDYVSVGIDSP